MRRPRAHSRRRRAVLFATSGQHPEAADGPPTSESGRPEASGGCQRHLGRRLAELPRHCRPRRRRAACGGPRGTQRGMRRPGGLRDPPGLPKRHTVVEAPRARRPGRRRRARPRGGRRRGRGPRRRLLAARRSGGRRIAGAPQGPLRLGRPRGRCRSAARRVPGRGGGGGLRSRAALRRAGAPESFGGHSVAHAHRLGAAACPLGRKVGRGAPP
mmetsp:Transcript_149560/g.461730  ORF Transcript_149560/g.461730 Transcript_149560/m.461730 type:complete len:214 (-) Transcript_149560:67-708(-)